MKGKISAVVIIAGEKMKNKKILNLYAPKEIEKAMKICDNLFYGNYLATGVLKTREELQQHIKNEITESFVQFWGNEFADELTKKIAETKIHFVYQVDGVCNSLNNYLLGLKKKRFNEVYDTACEAPMLFQSVRKMLAGGFVNPVKRLQKLLGTEQIEYSLFYCVDELKIDRERVLSDAEYARTIVKQIQTLGKRYKDIQYSDKPQVQKNILSLEKLVHKVKKNNYKQYKRGDKKLSELDPFVQKMKYDENAEILLNEPDFTGLQDDDCGVYFGIRADDATLLHEFVHQVDFQGFEKNHKDWVRLIYSGEMRQNEIFNEVVTDYFSMLMHKQRVAAGKPPIIANFENESLYSLLFDKMAKFLDAYLPELKVIRLREYPAEEFARIIGKKNFDMLAILCNELIALKHDLDVCESLQEKDQNLNDMMADSGVFLYGSMNYFMEEMQVLERITNSALDKTLNKVLKKQPLAKKIDSFLATQSQNIAERLEKNKNHKLSKLAPIFKNTATVLQNKAKKTAIKKLKAPLKSTDLKLSQLLQNQVNESTIAAEENITDAGIQNK